MPKGNPAYLYRKISPEVLQADLKFFREELQKIYSTKVSVKILKN
jgi:hypothetical protein